MVKYAVLAAVMLLLTACGAPTAVVLTTYAVDGVTYVSTGKTLTGHAMSAATDKDCSILFGITRGELCKDKEIPEDLDRRDAGFKVPKDAPATSEVASSSGTNNPKTPNKSVFDPPFFDFDYETMPVSAEQEKIAEKTTEAPIIEEPLGARTVAKKLPVVAKTTAGKQTAAGDPSANKPKWTLVLGAFADYRRAVELAIKVKPAPGLLTTILVDGKIHYRVSTPPLKRDQTKEKQLNIAALKLDSVRLMPVCSPWQQKDDCVALDRTLAIQQTKLP